MWGMTSGRHTVLIELDTSGGPPSGVIRVDRGRGTSFYGWIHLMAQLESLMSTGGSLDPSDAHARVEGGVN